MGGFHGGGPPPPPPPTVYGHSNTLRGGGVRGRGSYLGPHHGHVNHEASPWLHAFQPNVAVCAGGSPRHRLQMVKLKVVVFLVIRISAGLSLRTPIFFCFVKDSPYGQPPRTTNRHTDRRPPNH